MNTCRVVMDDLVYLGKGLRVATDSVLVKEERHQAVIDHMVFLSETADVNAQNPVFLPVAGKMPAYTAKVVYMEGGLEELEFKYAILKERSCGYAKPPTPIDAHLGHMIEMARKNWMFTKDSDAFYQYFSQTFRGRLIPTSASNGLDLHAEIYSQYDSNPFVKALYDEYSRWSARMLLNKGGSLMVGGPGCGKSYRVRLMTQMMKSNAWECDNHEHDDTRVLKPIVTSSMHSVIQLYRDAPVPPCEIVVDEDTSDDMNPNKPPTCMTLYKFAGCTILPHVHMREPDPCLEKRTNSRAAYVRTYDSLFIDEAETCTKSLEEFVKRSKEKFGMDVYLIGDPLQSTPTRGRGLDMEGSVSKYVCNNNHYEFDLQFRNVAPDYADMLLETGSGLVTKYLDPLMSNYTDGQASVNRMETLVKECAEDLLQGKVPITFACVDYKVNTCIVTAVLRKCVELDRGDGSYPPFVGDNTVLTHIGLGGCPYRDRQAYKKGKVDSDVVHMNRVNQMKEKCARILRGRSGNGPQGPAFMVGIPLILRKGIQFRVSTMFDTVEGKHLDKSTVLVFHHNVGPAVFMYPKGESNPYGTMDMFSFTLAGKPESTVLLTHMDVSMYLTYAFSIQKDFIIGATIDRMAVVQPYTRTMSNGRLPVAAYRRVKDSLEYQERVFGEYSVECSLSRFMRVAVTRGTGKETTYVIDLPVKHKEYWAYPLWSGSKKMVMHTMNTPDPVWHAWVYNWRRVIVAGQRDFTMVIGTNADAPYLPIATFPRDRLTKEVEAEDQEEVDRRKRFRFPLYLRV